MNTTYVLNKLNVPHGLTGSLQGTSSYSFTSSYQYKPINSTYLFVNIGVGDDSNGIRGDVSRPFETFTGASASAQAGDTIWFSGGVYASIGYVYGNVTLSLNESTRIAQISLNNSSLNIVGKGTIDYISMTGQLSATHRVDIEANTINGLYGFFSSGDVKVDINVSSNHLKYYQLYAYAAVGGYVSSSIKTKTLGDPTRTLAAIEVRSQYGPIRTDIQANSIYGYLTNYIVSPKKAVCNINVKTIWESPKPYIFTYYSSILNISSPKIQTISGSYTPSYIRSGSVSLNSHYITGSSLRIPNYIDLFLSGDPILSHLPITSSLTSSLRGGYTLL